MIQMLAHTRKQATGAGGVTQRNRGRELRRARSRPRVGALLAGSVFVVLSLWVAVAGTIPGEETVRVAMIAGTTRPIRTILHVANSFGARLTLITLGLVAIVLSRITFGDGVSIALILVLAAAAEAAVTWMIGRPCPEGTGVSYPSGHVFGSVVVYGMLASAISKCAARPVAHWLIACVAIAIIASVAVARIVLRLYWPSDVAAGLLGGGTYLLVARAWMDTTERREAGA